MKALTKTSRVGFALGIWLLTACSARAGILHGGEPDATWENNAMLLWLKADAGITIDGDSKVSLWADQSTHGHDAWQTDLGLQPVFSSTGVDGLHPAVMFDGPQVQLACGADPNNVKVPDPNNPITGHQTLFVVYQDTSNHSWVTPLGSSYNGKGSYHGQQNDSGLFSAVYTDPATLNGYNYRDGGEPIGNGTTTPRPDDWAVHAYVPKAPLTQSIITVGADQPCCGDRSIRGGIAEVILYDRALDYAQVNEVGGYLGEKYDIAWTEVLPPPPPPAVIDDSEGLPRFSFPGSALYSEPARGAAVNDAFAAGLGTPTATWTPQKEGEFYLQVHWLTGNVHEPMAVYTVTDADDVTYPFDVDQRLTGAQGAPGSLVVAPNHASGWYTLDSDPDTAGIQPFTLDAESTVVLTKAGPSGMYLAADAVRVDTDFIIDEESAAAYYTGDWAKFSGNFGGDLESTEVARSDWEDASVSYAPGVVGEFEVSLSWMAHPDHTADAQFFIDIDGDGVLDADDGDVNVLVNQQQLPDGTPALSHSWSGWYPLTDLHGTFELTLDTEIVLTNAVFDWDTPYLVADGIKLAAPVLPLALTWDGTPDADWAEIVGDPPDEHSHWTGGDPTDLPSATVAAIVDAGRATVTDARKSRRLEIAETGAVAVAAPDGELTVKEDVTVAAEAVLNVDGLLSAAGVVSEGTLSGSGKIVAEGIEILGLVTAGAGVGTLNVDSGELALVEGTYLCEIDSTGADLVHNLNMDGTIVLGDGREGGTLELKGIELGSAGSRQLTILSIEEAGTIEGDFLVKPTPDDPGTPEDERDYLGCGMFFEGYAISLNDYKLTVFQASLGDTDADGDVDPSDLSTLVQNWAPAGTGKVWREGNFDDFEDGNVDPSDLSALVQNWAPAGYLPEGAPPAGNSTAVPEPGTLLLLGMGGLCLWLLCRRRAA